MGVGRDVVAESSAVATIRSWWRSTPHYWRGASSKCGRCPAVHPWLGWPMLAIAIGAQVLRWWCITHAGAPLEHVGDRRPGAPRVTGALPADHPNYVAVVIEGIALPLIHTAWLTALCFTVLNAELLLHPHQGRERRAGEPDMIDLLVAGGGPAGLATALYGARAGL